MKNQSQDLLKQLKPVLALAKRYLNFLVVLLFLLIYTALVLRINQLNSAEPSPGAVSSKTQTLMHPHVDPQALAKIQQLQNQNIQVQALFNQARSNPFSE